MTVEFDDELLETVVRRKDALEALAAEPRHRRELQATLDVSKTTCHRIVRTFDERGLVRRSESGYELSALGRVVAEHVLRFGADVETAARMEPLLDLFEPQDEAVDHGVFADPRVDWTVRRDQSFTIDRGVELVEDAAVLRVLDWTPVPELYVEEIFGILAENEARVESVYPASEVSARLESFPDLHDELLEAGASARYWIYEDVPPWGMTIYDDSLVQLRAYDEQSGAYVLDATSGDSPAVEWALDVFAGYRDRADPVTAVEDLPDWGDYSW